MRQNQAYTLVFIKRYNFVLLGRMRTNWGRRIWNGFGGKVQTGESIIDAARRKFKQDTNLEANDLKQVGVIIHESANNDVVSVVHIFTACETTGQLKISEELDLTRWFHFADVPFDEMWPDATFWYPIMFRNKIFTIHVIYNVIQKLRYRIIYEFDSIQKAVKDVELFLSM